MIEPRVATLLTLCLFVPACGGGEQAARRPDIVLVVADTLRADRLSCYGYERDTSPFIDELAAEGAVFEDVTAQYAWTVPSMVSMFSGRYVVDRREILVPNAPCLAQSLRDAGYRTFAEVANQLVDAKSGLGRGFDHFDSSARTRARGTASATITGEAAASRSLKELGESLWAPLEQALAAEPAGDRAPFFIYLHALEPHHPYQRHRRLDAVLPTSESAPAWPDPWQSAILEQAQARFAPGDDVERKLRGIRDQRGRYDHEVRALDNQLRLIFERLGQLGLLEHAVVAVVSDHGEGLWDHPSRDARETPGEPRTRHLQPGEIFYSEHGDQLYSEAIATPLVLWGAGVPAGRRVPAPVENVDLFPTLLGLAGLPPPDGLHGRSLVGLLEGARDGRGLVVAYTGVGLVAVREPASGLKLLLREDVDSGAVRAASLYDLAADPRERADLLGARPQDAARLTDAFLAWREDHGGWGVAEDLIRQDLLQLERMRALGYMDSGVGAGRDD
jgi:arylsulfatase A-like enzyme